MRVYEDTKELVEKEIDEIVKKGEMSPTELEQLYKLIDIAKDICEIEEDKMGGVSGRVSYGTMPYWGQISYEDSSYGRNGRSGTNYNQNGSGRNYNNGRSSYGRDYDDRMMPDRRMDW